MYWANFFHIYHPSSQQPDILEAVVAQSYRPILQAIKNQKNVFLSMNVNGALLELFDKHGYQDLIQTLKDLMNEGRIEITGCAKYHAFLPLIEKDEIIRQIKLNDETNKFFLGSSYKPKGFFPPEMGYKEELAQIISDLGFQWIILDEIALGGQTGKVDYKKIYKIKKNGLLVFFRERRISNLIMSALVRTPKALEQAMKKDFSSGRYLLTAMDGETFGHHRPGLQNMLPELFAASKFQFIKISDIPKYFNELVEVDPVKSTWASSPDDI